ncbi:glycosyltransferase [Haliea sp. E17]|uniref:glycosyltransferase n=1 Tax=Haliea sp. E17 TaxID=3401576 RepID=UPI003AAA2DC5
MTSGLPMHETVKSHYPDGKQYHLLQELIFPGEQKHRPRENYFRLDEGEYQARNGKLQISQGSVFSTLTFYNAFSIAKWRNNTNIDAISLRLKGVGKCTLELRLATIPSPPPGVPEMTVPMAEGPVVEQLLSSRQLALTEDEEFPLDAVKLADSTSGLLFLRIHAQEDLVLDSIDFVTSRPPVNSVKLGIVITHFNRVSAIQSAVDRLKNELLHIDPNQAEVQLIIVDNSDNCGIQTEGNIRVIPNRNYGGAGGFSRGLLQLVDEGNITHCLFMDDDATCEIGSIQRMMSLFAYATTERLAIAGSLIQLADASTIYEVGGYFDGICHRIHRNLDTRSPYHLLLAEREVFKPNYGGWWFFGFCMKDLAFFPFPFFVRGDDVAFSLTNRFNVLTINGISAYGDTFEAKHNATTSYLDSRSHLVQQIAVLGHGRIRTLKGLGALFLKSLLSCRYGSADASIQAALDVMQGPSFFRQNLDMSSRFPLLRKFSETDRGVPLERRPPGTVVKQLEADSTAKKIAMILTLNGLLIPGFLHRKTPVYQAPGIKARLGQVFCHKHIYYAVTPDSPGELVSLDQWRATRLLCSFALCAMRLAVTYARLQKTYLEEFPGYASENFWRSTYSET